MIEVLPNGMIVNWGDFEWRVPGTKTTKRTKFFHVTCGNCGTERRLRAHDARRAKSCRHCAAVARGRKGYQATLAKHGKLTIQWHLQRNVRPSWAEDVVARWFDEEGVDYRRNEIFDTDPTDEYAAWYLVDFTIGLYVAVEVNGWSHKLPSRQRRDNARRAAWLSVNPQGRYIEITTDQIRADEEAARDFLMRELALGVYRKRSIYEDIPF